MTEEASNLKTEDVIIGFAVRAIAVTDEYVAVLE
jgi:hypothetical protein